MDMLQKLLWCWWCIPEVEAVVIERLANGFMSPASPIPADDVRIPFQAEIGGTYGELRLAVFVYTWGITFQTVEIGGIEMEVASSSTVNFLPIWFAFELGELERLPRTKLCNTRPFPR